MSGPYEDLKVLDFSHVIAGPFCTHLLADLGADVIKVEPRRGDLMRLLPVAFAGDLSSAFAQYNCGKRSLSLDLKSEEGLELTLRLVEWADIVVENFSPGTFDRLGLGYQTLHERNPGVILCSLSTFGAVGPYSHLSGFGVTAEAFSGLMYLTGEEGGSPMHFGTPLADMNSGVHALAAVGAALHRRSQTGQGAHIDISSFDSLFAMIDQAVAIGEFTKGERRFGRYGRTHSMTVPSGVVRAGDGEYVTYGCPSDALFGALAQAMDLPELAADTRFASVEARIENRDELYSTIGDWALGLPTADLLVEHLAEHGVPAARIRTVEENLDDAHLIERGTLSPVQVPELGDVLVQAAPFRMTAAEVGPKGPPPHIGEHTREVLAVVLGLEDAEIERLFDEGVAFTFSETAP